MNSNLLEKIYNKICIFCVNKTHIKRQKQELSFKLRCPDSIIDIAKLIKEFNGRCITIDTYKKQNDYILLYHFDVKNILITIEIYLKNKTINSISTVLKSTIWIEQVISQQYSIDFLDHVNMRKVFLDENMSKDLLEKYSTISEVMTNKY